MERAMIIPEPLNVFDNRLFDVSVQNLDLPLLIYGMKHEYSSKRGEPKVKILLNNQEKQVLLTLLHASTEIGSFQANESITFQIIEGRIKFQTRKESIVLEKGQMRRLTENIQYRLISDEETVLILIIINSTIKRYEN
jgi:hypothetical protein